MSAVATPQHRALAFTALIRLLQLIAGLVTMYGITGMLTSAGLRPPNPIVYVGLALEVLASIAQRSAGSRWSNGWWTFVGALSVSLVLATVPSLGNPECVSGEFAPAGAYCVGVGTHVVFVVATLTALISAICVFRAVRRQL